VSESSHQPRLLAILLGAWLLALAGGSLFLGFRLIGTLFTGTDLLVAFLLASGVALVFGYLNYRIGTRQFLSQLEMLPLSSVHAPTIHASVERLTQRMNADCPDVYIARLNQPNAFALGNRTLVIDYSLVRLLTPSELEGVLAHEFAHLERSDGLTQTLAMSVLQTVSTLVLLLLLPLFVIISLGCWGLSLMMGHPIRGPDSVGSGLRRGLGQIISGLLIAPVLALQAYSRHREYAADQRAVAVLDDPMAFARALKKIQRANEPDQGLFSWLFPSRERQQNQTPLEQALDSHPPTDERIRRVHEAAATGRRDGSSGRRP
jgi:heat shock protein HtpX